MKTKMKGMLPVAFNSGRYDDYHWDPDDYSKMYANGYLDPDEAIAAMVESREFAVKDNPGFVMAGFVIEIKTRTKVASGVYFPVVFRTRKEAECILRDFVSGEFSNEDYRKAVKTGIEVIDMLK